MPLVSGNNVSIDFTGQAQQLLAEAKKIEAGLDAISKKAQANRDEVTKLSEKYSGSLVPGLEQARESTGTFLTANAALIGGVVAVGAAAVKSYMAFQDYAGEVRDLALITGTGAEATSRFIQVIDDYQLTAQDAETATKRLKEKGLVPTIETLGMLATKYQAIHDPAEKMAFIQDNLGKGGAKWVNVLQQSASALEAQGKAVQSNLVLTDEEVKKSEEARLAIDAWNDYIHGIEISFGAWIGNMIAVNSETEKVAAQYRELTGTTGLLTNAHGELNKSVQAFEGQMARGAAETEYYNNQLKQTAVNADDAAAAQKVLADSGNQFMSVLSNVSSETASYTDKSNALFEQLQKLSDEQAKTPTWTDKYKELGTQIDSTKKSIGQLAAEQEKASKKIIFDLIAQRAAADGYKTITLDALLNIGEQMGVLDEKSVDTSKAFIDAATAIGDSLAYPKSQLTDMNSKVKNLQLLSLQGINIDATVTIHTIGSIPGGGSGVVSVGGGAGANQIVKKSWTGGQLGKGWTLVGDMPGGIPTPWSELISPFGHVYNAKDTKDLLRSGVHGFNSMAEAGDIYTSDSGGASGSPIANSIVGRNKPGKTGQKQGGGHNTPSISNIVDAVVSAIPATAASNSAAMQNVIAQQLAQQQAAIEESNRAVVDAINGLGDILKSDNPNAVGRAVGYQLAINS